MTRIKDLLPASWKGIPFYVRAEVLTEGGRRIVLHDYPNSSERFIEDLGELPPKFSITAFVTGTDFLDRAEQLERALKESGDGRLSMPTFGSRKLYALPYRKDASQTEVGEIRFDLEFVAGRSVSGPDKKQPTTQTVYSLGDTAREAIADALKDAWIDPESSSNVLTSAFDLIQYVEAAKRLITIVNNVSDINSISDFIGLNAFSIVRSATGLSSAFISRLWQTISVGLSAGAGLSTLISLTRFGSQLSLSLSDIRNATISDTADSGTAIPLWAETTSGRIIRNTNRLSLINAGRVSALVTAYEQAADSSYKTDTDIDDVRSSLESEHERLMRIDTYDRDLIQSKPVVRSAVEKTRLASLSVLDQKEQSTYTLTNVRTGSPIGAFILAYNLYAEEFKTSDEVTTRGVELRKLNPDLPSDKLSNNVTVFQK